MPFKFRLATTLGRPKKRAQCASPRGNGERKPLPNEGLPGILAQCSETLRKLNLAVEMARRDAEEQVPKKLAESDLAQLSEWLRIAFAQFLSSEARRAHGHPMLKGDPT